MSDADVSAPRVIPITEIEQIKRAGIIVPDTTHGWRWLWRHRAENGMAEAFVKVGNRVCVDVEGYHAAILRMRKTAAA